MESKASKEGFGGRDMPSARRPVVEKEAYDEEREKHPTVRREPHA